MPKYEFKVVSAPERSSREFTQEENQSAFDQTLTGMMNDLSAEGWEFVGAEALPETRRRWVFRRTTVTRNVLVFRRPLRREPRRTPRADRVPARQVAAESQPIRTDAALPDLAAATEAAPPEDIRPRRIRRIDLTGASDGTPLSSPFTLESAVAMARPKP